MGVPKSTTSKNFGRKVVLIGPPYYRMLSICYKINYQELQFYTAKVYILQHKSVLTPEKSLFSLSLFPLGKNVILLGIKLSKNSRKSFTKIRLIWIKINLFRFEKPKKPVLYHNLQCIVQKLTCTFSAFFAQKCQKGAKILPQNCMFNLKIHSKKRQK